MSRNVTVRVDFGEISYDPAPRYQENSMVFYDPNAGADVAKVVEEAAKIAAQMDSKVSIDFNAFSLTFYPGATADQIMRAYWEIDKISRVKPVADKEESGDE